MVFGYWALVFLSCNLKPEYKRINSPISITDKEGLTDLRSADEDFRKLICDNNQLKAFRKYADDHVIVFQDNDDPIRDLSNLENTISQLKLQVLRPVYHEAIDYRKAGSSESITSGLWKFIERDEEGNNLAGSYITIWQKDSKGNWKIIMDKGSFTNCTLCVRH